jgi:hypothetical protein
LFAIVTFTILTSPFRALKPAPSVPATFPLNVERLTKSEPALSEK